MVVVVMIVMLFLLVIMVLVVVKKRQGVVLLKNAGNGCREKACLFSTSVVIFRFNVKFIITRKGRGFIEECGEWFMQNIYHLSNLTDYHQYIA